MAAETTSSKSSTASADSYIGSLISLTSKSEIRYEGILYNINTEESSIGLRNVRSFGTEGRKKDGPQVLPSDKIFEYILFRGTDIKDLQVKSSPPLQIIQSLNSDGDPAIIQSHYSRPPSASPSLNAPGSGSVSDLSSHNAQLVHPGTSFQGSLPLYQTGGNLGPWGSSPTPPGASGSGLAMPMYWQGYYGPPSGIPSLHQQSLLHPPPGLSMPPALQQPMQYINFNASLPTGSSTLPSSNMPEYPPPLVPSAASSSNLTTLPVSAMSAGMPPVQPFALTSDALANLVSSKAPTIPASNTTLPPLPSMASSIPNSTAILPTNSNKSVGTSAPSLSHLNFSQPLSSVVATSIPLQTEISAPALVTPGQLLLPTTAAISLPQHSQADHKDVEVVQVSPFPSTDPVQVVLKESQPPILPLPTSSHSTQKFNGASFQGRYNYRGRDRRGGTVSSRPITKFTEEFDFMAMNEKFKKDEVWGHLGKNKKCYPQDKGDEEGSDEDDFQEELPKFEMKAVYNKDDFFDSLSCDALKDDSQNGRRFSEQVKIDTETFGDFARYRGGRGPGRGGRFRGSYHGRGGYGYGYSYRGRGRGRGGSIRPF